MIKKEDEIIKYILLISLAIILYTQSTPATTQIYYMKCLLQPHYYVNPKHIFSIPYPTIIFPLIYIHYPFPLYISMQTHRQMNKTKPQQILILLPTHAFHTQHYYNHNDISKTPIPYLSNRWQSKLLISSATPIQINRDFI